METTFKKCQMYDKYYTEKYNQIHTCSFINIIDLIIKETEIKDNTIMLDIGCGFGNTLHYFQEKNISIQGIDSSVNMVQQAEKQKNGPIICEDIHLSKILYEESYFTHLLLLGENTANEIITDEFLHNARYWLKKGGYLVIHNPQKTAFQGKSTWTPFKRNDKKNNLIEFASFIYQEKENEILFTDKQINETRLYEKATPFSFSPEQYGFHLHFEDSESSLQIFTNNK